MLIPVEYSRGSFGHGPSFVQKKSAMALEKTGLGPLLRKHQWTDMKCMANLHEIINMQLVDSNDFTNYTK